MTLEPTSMASTFEDVIVQNWPAWPAFSEHSFVTWSSPLRGKEADDARPDRPVVALGLVGSPLPPHPTTATAPAQRHPTATRFILRTFANVMSNTPCWLTRTFAGNVLIGPAELALSALTQETRAARIDRICGRFKRFRA